MNGSTAVIPVAKDPLKAEVKAYQLANAKIKFP